MAFPGCTPFFRGGTIRFSTTFKDPDLNVIQPYAAVVNVLMPVVGGSQVPVAIAMTPPVAPATAWTARLDTRNAAPGGTVFWSIHSLNDVDEIPYAVGDGSFQIAANAANPATFP